MSDVGLPRSQRHLAHPATREIHKRAADRSDDPYTTQELTCDKYLKSSKPTAVRAKFPPPGRHEITWQSVIAPCAISMPPCRPPHHTRIAWPFSTELWSNWSSRTAI